MIKIDYLNGATPLDLDEIAGLIPDVQTHAELNAWEQQNIIEADAWAIKQLKRDILTTQFILELHRRMFQRVWRWAGRFRNTNKNIGVDKFQVALQVAELCKDAKAWLDFNTYSLDEIAIRLHHKLVWIHPFHNGNGRHARLIADLLMQKLGKPRFTWGTANLYQADAKRDKYIQALRLADNYDYQKLIKFVNS